MQRTKLLHPKLFVCHLVFPKCGHAFAAINAVRDGDDRVIYDT
jgi:hypothetical protein